jgi:hypothetical protein
MQDFSDIQTCDLNNENLNSSLVINFDYVTTLRLARPKPYGKVPGRGTVAIANTSHCLTKSKQVLKKSQTIYLYKIIRRTDIKYITKRYTSKVISKLENWFQIIL